MNLSSPAFGAYFLERKLRCQYIHLMFFPHSYLGYIELSRAQSSTLVQKLELYSCIFKRGIVIVIRDHGIFRRSFYL